MDTGTLLAVCIILGIAFLITSQAKDKNGKKYGIKNMTKIWVVALGILGFYALINPSIEAEGFEKVKISIVPIFLIVLPFAMIASNILRLKNRKKQNK